jgi:hypothetical protein
MREMCFPHQNSLSPHICVQWWHNDSAACQKMVQCVRKWSNEHLWWWQCRLAHAAPRRQIWMQNEQRIWFCNTDYRCLRGRCPHNEEMEMAVHEWLQMQERYFYHNIILKFLTRWEIRITVAMDWVGYFSGTNKLHLTLQRSLISYYDYRNLLNIVHNWWWLTPWLLCTLQSVIWLMCAVRHCIFCTCTTLLAAVTVPNLTYTLQSGVDPRLEKLHIANLGIVTVGMGLTWPGLGGS